MSPAYDGWFPLKKHFNTLHVWIHYMYVYIHLVKRYRKSWKRVNAVKMKRQKWLYREGYLDSPTTKKNAHMEWTVYVNFYKQKTCEKTTVIYNRWNHAALTMEKPPTSQQSIFERSFNVTYIGTQFICVHT
jgi:hypothetical protein